MWKDLTNWQKLSVVLIFIMTFICFITFYCKWKSGDPYWSWLNREKYGAWFFFFLGTIVLLNCGLSFVLEH